MTTATNSQHLGLNYRGQAWDDGKPITRVDMGDGTEAEAQVGMGYVWNGAGWVRAPGDSTNGFQTQQTLTRNTVTYKAVAASASGDTLLVTGGVLGAIRVHAVFLSANGTVNVKFKDSVAGDITGLMYLIANTGFVLPFSPDGWFQVADTNNLMINLSAAQAVGGGLVYSSNITA